MITAVLSWYDESPTWLAVCVASAARFCDQIVAVDGAFALYPGGRASSGAEQHEAILKTAEAAGMGATVLVPRETWAGNEVEKRDFVMRTGAFVSRGSEDWLFIIDADEVIIDAPPKAEILERLAATERHVATVTLGVRHDHYAWMQRSEAFPDGAEPLLPDSGAPPFAGAPIRRFFRADPSLRVEDSHYGFTIDVEGEPLRLWDLRDGAPAAVLDEVLLEHRNRYRDPSRAAASREFYRLRDDLGVEATPLAMGAV